MINTPQLVLSNTYVAIYAPNTAHPEEGILVYCDGQMSDITWDDKQQASWLRTLNKSQYARFCYSGDLAVLLEHVEWFGSERFECFSDIFENADYGIDWHTYAKSIIAVHLKINDAQRSYGSNSISGAHSYYSLEVLLKALYAAMQKHKP